MKKKRIVTFIQLLLFLSGSFIIAKPLYKIGSLKYREMRIQKIKQKWKQYDQDTLSFVYWLEIPAVNISYPILMEPDRINLDKYPCLKFLDPQKKQNGMKTITAHRDMHFYNLKMLNDSDHIFLEKQNGEKKEYQILEIEILPTEIAERKLMEKKDEDWLILMTCYPFHFIGPAPERFVVWAKEIERG